jgi:hypothetical protein
MQNSLAGTLSNVLSEGWAEVWSHHREHQDGHYKQMVLVMQYRPESTQASPAPLLSDTSSGRSQSIPEMTGTKEGL